MTPGSKYDPATFTGERQQAPDLSGIQMGHCERYFFAANVVAGNVLDAGCGCGYGSKIMHDTGAVVTGIDLEKDAIEYAMHNYPGPEYIVADVTKYRAPYNWVVSFENLEHLPDPIPALKNYRASRHLIISTPNEIHYPFSRWRGDGDRFPHVRHYTPAQLDDLLASCGWAVRSRHCQVSKMGPVVEGVDGIFLIYVCD